MSPLEVTSFVNGLLKNRVESGSFKNHLRHFLIQSEEYSIRDNKLVYKREAERRRMLSIPEVVAPSELHDDMIDT
ncbi:protein EXPORTIN 1B-like [Physcomitrium patens]|uniref:protein EXPORTIN 1B-like n=1 Tax=Physcomitrium patens TaxID=3218 RepID=UPI003CCD8212